MKQVRVLIVDDSLMYRMAIKNALEGDPQLLVIGMSPDPMDAKEKILSLNPDVVTLDVEMPGMDGITFLKLLKKEKPVPVVVVSAVDGIVFEAMRAGAVDFVAKPEAGQIQRFTDKLKQAVLVASDAKLSAAIAVGDSGAKATQSRAISALSGKAIPTTGIIAIGASTGGTEATSYLMKSLPNNIPGIVITQHMPKGFTKLYADRLNRESKFDVSEAKDGDVIASGKAFVAPGGRQMRVERRNGAYVVRLGETENVGGHCPAVNVLFDSVAKAAKDEAMGVILTGMGSDGAKGLKTMREAGAFTIGQDEQSCVVYGMPMEAYKCGAVMRQASLENIPNVVVNQLIKAGKSKRQ